jgi:hypothetical protein
VFPCFFEVNDLGELWNEVLYQYYKMDSDSMDGFPGPFSFNDLDFQGGHPDPFAVSLQNCPIDAR